MVYAMVEGSDDFVEQDVLELRGKYSRSLEIVEGPLMRGMREVGERFGEGKMFLPQVIRSARVMKKAVAVLEPFMQREKAALSGGTGSLNNEPQTDKILLATVKGDVHDIGKNIVGVVLGCNGYDIVDLGVMIPAARIIEAALREKAALVGLSGLITPSLDEMVNTARARERQGLRIPLIIGGATTSLAHTALRIAPEYSGPVVYVRDAGQCPAVVRALLSDTERPRFLEELESSYREAAARHEAIQSHIELIPLESARANRVKPPATSVASLPAPPGREDGIGLIDLNGYPLEKIIPRINWDAFLESWELAGKTSSKGPAGRGGGPEEARKRLLDDAGKLLDRVCGEKILRLRGVAGIFPAASLGDDVVIYAGKGNNTARFSFLRNQAKKRNGAYNPCLADFIQPAGVSPGGPEGRLENQPEDRVGLFALSAGFGLSEAAAAYKDRGDDYGAILLGTLTNSLAEAFSEEAHRLAVEKYWSPDPGPRGLPPPAKQEGSIDGIYGIRPAFGYAACPDHRDKETVFRLLEAERRCGLSLTESAMIVPAASVCGMYLFRPGSFYFSALPAGEDQLENWA
ncbi:MAG: B12-binding domain-containing protein, partial [Treponema sp.]|nr:B12-binding domain-containing protein [Treponema sp.]